MSSSTEGTIGENVSTFTAIVNKFSEGVNRIINFPTYARLNYFTGRNKYKSIAFGVGITTIFYFVYKFYKKCKDAGGEGRSFVRGFADRYWVPVMNDFRVFDLESHPQIQATDSTKPLTWHYSEYDESSTETYSRVEDSESYYDYYDSKQLPSEVLALVQATRILGHFEAHSLSEIWKNAETVSIPAGESLFKKGDPDDQIYILIDGQMEIKSHDASVSYKPFVLKKVKPGGQLYSVLSFVDVITGNTAPIKTVEAVAIRNSVVLKIPSDVFRVIWMQDMEIMKRSIRRLIRRVYQVVFVALHKILGLTIELVKHEVYSERQPVDPYLVNVVDISPEEKAIAIQGLLEFLQLTHEVENPDEHPIFSKLRVMILDGGFSLLSAGNRSSAFVFVYKGELEVSRWVEFDERDEKEHEQTLFYVSEGQGIGGLSYLTDDVNIFNVIVPQKAIVVVIPEELLESLCNLHPICILPVANSVVSKLSLFTRCIDFGIEWVHVDSNSNPIYKVGDEADCTYLVLSGRLRSILTEKGKKVTMGEYGRNDWIGLVETLTKKRRSKTVLPVRDSELAKIPEGVLHMIKLKFPIVTIRLLDFLGNRVAKNYRSELEEEEEKIEKVMHSLDSTHKGCSTVALIPATKNVPTMCCAFEIFSCYKSIIGTCKIIRRVDIVQQFGESGLERSNDYLLASWLAQQEEQSNLVIYVADPTVTNWSIRCTSQADTILILANAEEDYTLGPVENMARIHALRANKELVLFHNYKLVPTEESYMPSRGLPINSRKWLEIRKYLAFHHHIRLYPAHTVLMYEDDERIARYYADEWIFNRFSDFARLTRWISGTATGIVLGGGGAKGAAHVGMIKSILEHEIPIDLICGTSIGSFVGALYAAFQDIDRVDEYCKDWFLHMTKWYQYIMDLTVPVISVLEGEAFNESLKSTFQDIQIEDLWIPYFCLTTDVTGKGPRIHKCGTVWKYVRASMTLAGYFPPMCDPIDGHYLMDGGYTNLVPANIMREFGAKFVIAIDVSSEDDTATTNYGEHLSGLRIIAHNLIPFLPDIRVPNVFKLQSQLSFIQSALYLEMVKKMDVATIYLRPPIDEWNGGDFTEYKAIKYTGYRYATEVFYSVVPGDTLIEKWISMNPHAPLTHDERLSQMFSRRPTAVLSVRRDPSNYPIPSNPITRAQSGVTTGLYEQIRNRTRNSIFGDD